tara:strand:- start:3646 stop:4281 length:636 start_codon:yes stop_codon:yes gene_type:complete
MNWELRHVGGSLETRLKNAERHGITVGDEINNIRSLDRSAKMLFNSLKHFINKVSSLPEVKDSKITKKITLKVKVLNSVTFNTNKCIAWIKKANTNCFGQCGKKCKEDKFCGFHCLSKQHLKPVSTIYDHIDLHILYQNKSVLKIISKESNSYSSKDLSNTYKINWRKIDVFINPTTLEMYHKFTDRIKLIGLTSYNEDELYAKYLELLDN